MADNIDSKEREGALGPTFAWDGVKVSGIAVGQRCVVKSRGLFSGYQYDPSFFDKFIAEFGARSKWPVGRETIHALAYKVGGCEILELSGQRASVSPDDLALLQSDLEQARDYITAAIWPPNYSEASLSVAQAFAFVELPGWLKSSLTAEIVTAAIPASFVSVSNGKLTLGSESEDALTNLQRYFAGQYKAAREGGRLDRINGASVMYVPWTLVALMLGTWFVQLGPLTLLAAAVVTTIPMAVLAWQSRAVGWRLYLLRPGAVTAVALYSIALFGVAYGVCALCDSALPSPSKTESLGNSFLIATSMGLAGGVVGDSLTGAALRVAHVQLLLFLGGLGVLVAQILRIGALLKDRE